MDACFSPIPFLKGLFLGLIVKKVDFDIIKYTYRTFVTILTDEQILIAGFFKCDELKFLIDVMLQIRNKLYVIC